MLSKLELRIRSRRSFRRYPLFSALDQNCIGQSMLGCLLVLLIIFMIGSPPVDRFLVDSYHSQHAVPMPQALRDDAMKLAITRDGMLYFGNTKIATRDLRALIRQRVASGTQHKVFIAVDPRAKYGDVSIALDGIRGAGIRDIAFLSEVPVLHR